MIWLRNSSKPFIHKDLWKHVFQHIWKHAYHWQDFDNLRQTNLHFSPLFSIFWISYILYIRRLCELVSFILNLICQKTAFLFIKYKKFSLSCSSISLIYLYIQERMSFSCCLFFFPLKTECVSQKYCHPPPGSIFLWMGR